MTTPMTEEELDEARAREAHDRAYRARFPRWRGSNFNILTVEDKEARILAARLAREGWTPTDPDLIEAREIVARVNEPQNGDFTAMVRAGHADGHGEVRVALAAIKQTKAKLERQP